MVADLSMISRRQWLVPLMTILACLAMAGCVGPMSNLTSSDDGTSASLRGQSPDYPSSYPSTNQPLPPPAGGLAPGGMTPSLGGTLPLTAAAEDRSDAGAIVLGVKIAGNKNVKESEIRRHLKTRKDRAYDPQLVQDDLRRLYSTRKFYNLRTSKEHADGGVYITFQVLERPTIGEVMFIGNKYISDKRLLKETGLKKGDSLNVYTVQEARRKVEELYQSKGLARTVVTVEEGEKTSDHRVVLRVDEGPVERIWKIRFIGNDPRLATDARLATQIKSKPGFLKYLFRGKVNHNQIDEDVERLTAYYRGLGYFRATVGRELEYGGSGQWVTVNYVINEGPRFEVRNVSVVGNEKFTEEQITEQFDLKAGEFFNLDKMQRDENVLRDLYGRKGISLPTLRRHRCSRKSPGNWTWCIASTKASCFAWERSRSTSKENRPRRNGALSSIAFHCGQATSLIFEKCEPASGGSSHRSCSSSIRPRVNHRRS